MDRAGEIQSSMPTEPRVPPENKADRSAAELLSLAGRARELGRITKGEIAELRRHGRDRVGRFQSDIQRALEGRDLRRAKKLCRKMASCAAVRFWALDEAERRRNRNERRDADELLTVCRDIDIYRRTAQPTFYQKKKPEGGFRPIYVFGPDDKACAILIAAALKPFARAHPTRACHSAQKLLAGGTPAACEELRDALSTAPEEACFVHVDVKGFYQAIAVEMLSGITGLAPEVVRQHLAVRPRRVRKGSHRTSNVLLTDLVVTRREGLDRQSDHRGGERPESGGTVPMEFPTGSAASSVVAEMVMGAVLRDVGALRYSLCTVVYSDNVGVLAPSRETAEAIKAALLSVLAAHRLGPFSASQATICPIQRGFRYLGYHWVVREGIPNAQPIQRKHEFWQLTTIAEAQMGEYHGDPERVETCLRSLRSYCANFTLWAGASAFEAKLGQELKLMRSRARWQAAGRSSRTQKPSSARQMAV